MTTLNRIRQAVDPVVTALRPRPAKLTVVTIRNEAEYREHVQQTEMLAAARAMRERNLERVHHAWLTRGFCYVCDRWTLFNNTWAYAGEVAGRRTPNWREHMRCSRCQLTARGRASIHLLAEHAQIPTTRSVFITEQSTELHDIVARRYPRTLGSEYLGDTVPRGRCNADGVRNEDLTRLTFDDCSFDAIMCFEVLEHIPHYRKALRECARVLRTSGRMLFSVPFNRDASKNLIRARVLADGSIEHLLAPEYHGDPMSEAGCLCFQHFGWEMLDEVRRCGFSSVMALLYYSAQYGYIGGEQMLFLAVK